MFCDYCLQLFQYCQAPERYIPPKPGLGGDSKAIANQSQDTDERTRRPPIEIYEESNGPDACGPAWWKTPVYQANANGALNRPAAFECHICMMIYSNVSASVVNGLVKRFRGHRDSLSFLYKLNNQDLIKDAFSTPSDVSYSRGKRRLVNSQSKDLGAVLSVWLKVNDQLLPMIQLKVAPTYESSIPESLASQNATTTRASSVTSLAASWLQRCVKNHPNCKRSKGKEYRLPTRLINVGKPNSSKDPYLWVPEKGSAPVPYMTLSHRWGVSREVILTVATLLTFTNEIPAAKLPQAIQDAIIISRCLGVRYLWVDSLCIIQDSLSDWQAESASMRDVYKYAYCTISASWASTDAEGCFTMRGPLQAQLCGNDLANLRQHITSDKSTQDNATNEQGHVKSKVKRQHVRLDAFDKNGPVDKSIESTSVVKQDSSGISPDSSLLMGAQDLQISSGFGHSLQKTRSGSRNPSQGTATHGSCDATPDLDNHELSVDVKRCSEEEVELARQRAHCPSYGRVFLSVKTLHKDLWAHSVDSSPLSYRAWALQERLLSPRILHYTKTQLFWECKSTRACETWPNPVSKVVYRLFESSEHLKSTHELYGLNAEPLYEHWLEIVEKYTDTFMTKPEDKLVAMSGLAKEVHDYTKDLYCAGLWRKDLIIQLAWRMQRPQHCTQMAYRAPTWSWASVDGKVTFMANNSLEITSEVHILSIRTLGLNSEPYPFGQVSYGYLRLRGMLKVAQNYTQQGGTYKLLLTEELQEAPQASYAEFYPDITPKNTFGQLICLPILSCQDHKNPSKEDFLGEFLIGLVLSSTGEFRDEYRRVGAFQMPNPPGREWFTNGEEEVLQSITII